MPKLDENQEEYATSCTVYWATFFSIPTSNVEKLDATCYLLEAMAYYGQEMCTYEYYDKTLKLKGADIKSAPLFCFQPSSIRLSPR